MKKLRPFPPGHYYKDGEFVCYCDITKVDEICQDDLEQVCANIREKLVTGIEKRLVADAKVGFLLSGGLDSSLVCAVAARKSKTPIRTFAIGMQKDAIDLKYAKEVADYIGSEHTEVIITKEDVLSALEDVIGLLGTFDITTIRASIGMYLVCKAIHEQTDIRVLLTGEISDELFGYKYTDFAPSAQAFQKESEKRVRELHMYDVLRADRCISVKFSGSQSAIWRSGLCPVCDGNRSGEKAECVSERKIFARHAFEKGDYLPEHSSLERKGSIFGCGGTFYGRRPERVR